MYPSDIRHCAIATRGRRHSLPLTVVEEPRSCRSVLSDWVKSVRMADAKHLPYLVFPRRRDRAELSFEHRLFRHRSLEHNYSKSSNGPPAMAFYSVLCRCVELQPGLIETCSDETTL